MCAGLGTGSGFAIERSVLSTIDVTAAEVGALGDVAFVEADGELPVVADVAGRAPPGAEMPPSANGLGLAMPMGTAWNLLEHAGTTRVPPCGVE